jgi:two-component system LytT family sensor kinase
MTEQRLIILLLKLAVAASLASILLRVGAVKQLLGFEIRSVRERLVLAAAFSVTYGASVATRIFTRGQYMAVDLGMEGSFLAGLVGGYVTGLISGLLVSIPAILGGEYASLALFPAVGVLGGLLRDFASDGEEIWKLSPFFDLGLYRILFKWKNLQKALFHVAFYSVGLLLEFVRGLMGQFFGAQYLFSLSGEWNPVSPVESMATSVTTMFAVAVSLTVWNSGRYEGKLESQNRLLAEARMAALMRQINPHFLFNTLNAISSLVRVDPEKARDMIHKLSAILRRLLREPDHLCPLRDELAFIDDYLAIEMVRFGAKLRVLKEIAPETLDFQVPSMLLQPIVENSIRHGLSGKIDGGTVRLRSSLANGRVLLTVEDDGVGIEEERLAGLFEQGIGVSNVNERLKVLYGDQYRMEVDSKAGQYTRTEIEIPGAISPISQGTSRAGRS